MKLAYVLGTFPSVTETFILREIVELRRRGFELRLFALRRPAGGVTHDEAAALVPWTTYRRPLPSGAVLGAVAHFVVRRPLRTLGMLGRTLAGLPGAPLATLKALRNVPAALYFAREAGRWGVAHVHAHFAFTPADVGRMMADLLGTDFSFSAHASDIYLLPSAALARQARAARFVAVCSRYGCEEFRRRVGAALASRAHLVYHGVPLPPPMTDGDPDEIVPLVLAIGRLQPKKGFATLVEACGLLRARGVPFRCVIAGAGPERAALAGAAARAGLGDALCLAGEQSRAQLAALLRRARVLAAPCVVAPDGDRDGLPNAILEALAAGVPVVATPVSAIPEAVEHGRTGLLVPPGDARALAAALEELLKNAPLCRTLRDVGRAAVAARFDIARTIDPLADLFMRARGVT